MHWTQEPESENLISTHEMCRRAKVTYRMLDYWVAIGFVAPAVQAEGSGTTRLWFRYQIGEVAEIRAIKDEQRRLDRLMRKRQWSRHG